MIRFKTKFILYIFIRSNNILLRCFRNCIW